jgi:hypothetical protein
MAASTILSCFYQATIVLFHLTALAFWMVSFVFWNIAKWTPAALSSLWAVASSASRVLRTTHSILCSLSGTVGYYTGKFVAPIAGPVLRTLWMLLTYDVKVTLAVWIVAVCVLELTDDLAKFDKRMAQCISRHRARQAQAQADGDDTSIEAVVPTGAYDYSTAYQLEKTNESTNSEE